MIIDFRNQWTYLANTKVASTATEQLLGKFAHTGRIGGHPRLKHIDFESYKRMSSGLGTENFVTVCVVRHPISKFVSWWKFRSRDEIKARPRWTGDKSLDHHIETAKEFDIEQSDDRNFACAGKDRVDLIFKYEELCQFEDFLGLVLGQSIELPKANVSGRSFRPSKDQEEKIGKLLASAVEWYEQLASLTGREAFEIFLENSGK